MRKTTNLFQKTQKLVECPSCFSLIELAIKDGELQNDIFCKSCGTCLTILSQNNDKVELLVHEEKIVPIFVLLKSIINQKKRLFVLRIYSRQSSVPETSDIIFEDEMDFLHSHQFSYNFEYPASSYLKNLVCIFGESEVEPYKFFEFVAAKEASIDESDKDFEEKLKLLFSEDLKENESIFFD
jgi:hypothetical protein